MRFAVGAIALLALSLAGPALAAVPAGCKVQQLVELPVTMVGTRPTVAVTINGKAERLLLDSGAAFSMLTPQAAKRLGLNTIIDSRVIMGGVGGAAVTRSTTVEQFTLGNQVFRKADFLVVEGAGGGVAGLLGEDLLGGVDVEYDLANGVVRIFKPEKCGDVAMAYWAKDGFGELPLGNPNSPLNRQIEAYGSLNGQAIKVTFDTGASRSVLTLRAAARAGVTPQTAGAVFAGQTSGIGPKIIDTWIAPFDSFKIGSEEIQHTRLRIGDLGLDTDMLLGADFFLSHRVYVSNIQHRIYFTYNGGQVFMLEAGAQVRAPETDKLSEPAATAGQLADQAVAAPLDLNTPTDAAGFARRGAAYMGRLEYAHAIEDYTRAIGLEPANPEYLYLRGRARNANRQPILAMSDFDQALKLKPDYAEVLIARAILYNSSGDKVRARADLDAAAATPPTDAQSPLFVANTYARLGFSDEALAGYDRWIAANRGDPSMSRALENRCYVRAELKTELDKALTDCDASLKLNPRNASALQDRGLVHLLRGEPDAAIADYDFLLKEYPKNAISLYGRGVAKQKKGMKEAGDADITAAVDIAPKIAEQAKRLGMIP